MFKCYFEGGYQKLDQTLPFILTMGLSSVQIFHSYETNSELGIEETGVGHSGILVLNEFQMDEIFSIQNFTSKTWF